MGSLLRRARTRLLPAGDDGGFTLIEAVVALVVFALLSVGVAAGLQEALSATRQNRGRALASGEAQALIEQIRNEPLAQIPDGQSTYTQTAQGTTFTVTQTAAFVQDSTPGSSCDSGSAAGIQYKRITLSVAWPAMGSSGPVRVDTLKAITINPLAGGVLAVKVSGAAGTGQQGVSITTTSGSYAQTQLTGTDGCAVFTGVPTGATATAKVATVPGWAQPLGQSLTQLQTVTAGALNRVFFNYDAAATYALAPSLPTYAPTGLPVTLYNNGGTPASAPYCTSSTLCTVGFPRSVTGLYPYSSGYQAWAGSCADADPLYYSGGSRGASTVASPGGSGTGTVTVTQVTATNTTSGATALYASHDADGTCTSGESYQIGTAAIAKNGTGIIALPYGTWYLSKTAGVHASHGNDQKVVIAATATLPSVTVSGSIS